MKAINALFNVHRARSGLPADYESGEVPYVGNGLADNAVVALVKPRPGDRVFDFRGIAISAFCEATVQTPPFVACSRAGNGLVVLEPKETMPVAQMAYVAAYINRAVSWRFSWYRQTTADRIGPLLVPDTMPPGIKFDVRAALPPMAAKPRPAWQLQMRPFALGDLYTIQPGDYHSLSELPRGDTPVVSCGDADNGVTGYYAITKPECLYENRLTISFNGMNTLTAKFHSYQFAAKDDVAVCLPRRPLRVTTEVFIQLMVNRERWRYSYYRKCFAEKLRRFEINLPFKDGEIDEDLIEGVVAASPYWGYLAARSDAVRNDRKDG